MLLLIVDDSRQLASDVESALAPYQVQIECADSPRTAWSRSATLTSTCPPGRLELAPVSGPPPFGGPSPAVFGPQIPHPAGMPGARVPPCYPRSTRRTADDLMG